jgi:glutaminase
MTWKKIFLAGTFAAVSFVAVYLPAQQSRGSANRSIVAPAHDRIKTVVDEAYGKFRSDTTGKNADYIPYH